MRKDFIEKVAAATKLDEPQEIPEFTEFTFLNRRAAHNVNFETAVGDWSRYLIYNFSGKIVSFAPKRIGTILESWV